MSGFKTYPSRTQFNNGVEKKISEVFKYYRDKNCDWGSRGYFEQEYKSKFNNFLNNSKGYVETTCSGTAALFVILSAFNFEAGSEILVSPITDPGSISPFAILNLKVKIFDFDKKSFLPTLESIKIRTSKKTKAIVLNHLSGKAVSEIELIANWCKENNIILIEDCSQSHGASVGGKKLGVFGEVSFFSTMYSKNHSTGGNGAVIYTENSKLANLITLHIHKGKPHYLDGFNEKNPNEFILPALNLEISEINHAIGTVTLSILTSVNKRRNDFLFYLFEEFNKLKIESKLLQPSYEDAPYFAMIVLPEKVLINKKEFVSKLIKDGIGINGQYPYVVNEWNWAQSILFDEFFPENAVAFRNTSINLLFNENYNENHAKEIAMSFLAAENCF
jgi:dTDP-4-amino-4,6-dideoxygalactose transaminase